MIYHIRENVRTRPFELVICILSLITIQQIMEILITRPEILRDVGSGFLSLPKAFLWTWCVFGLIGVALLLIGLVMSIFSFRARAVETSGLW